MSRFLAVLQLGLGIILLIVAATTLINMLFIAPRPETISVVNAIVGQLVVIVCFLALGRLLIRRGWMHFRQHEATDQAPAGRVSQQAAESDDDSTGA